MCLFCIQLFGSFLFLGGGVNSIPVCDFNQMNCDIFLFFFCYCEFVVWVEFFWSDFVCLCFTSLFWSMEEKKCWLYFSLDEFVVSAAKNKWIWQLQYVLFVQNVINASVLIVIHSFTIHCTTALDASNLESKWKHKWEQAKMGISKMPNNLEKI